LTEDSNVRVFENNVLKRLFGYKKEARSRELEKIA
jgi:hypothetical protein